MSAHPLLAEASGLGKAARICRDTADSLTDEKAEGARRAMFAVQAEAQRLLARLGKPEQGFSPEQIRERTLEREAVIRVIQRHVQSSHFLRIRAAVDSDAKTRGAA